MSKLKLNYKNLKQKNIGENGLSEKELCSLDQRLLCAFRKFSEQAKDYNVLVETGMAWRKSYTQKDDIEKVKSVARGVLKDFNDGEIRDFVIFGIGGSDLGSRALHEALNNGVYYNLRLKRSFPRIHFIGDNSSPEEVAGLLSSVDLKKTLFNVISKSGTTPETLANYYILRKKLENAVGKTEANKHVIATTGENEKSELWLAGHEGQQGTGKFLFRAFLPVPEGVGGRFSVFSPVGLLYAAVSGLNIDELIEGLRQAENRANLHPLSDENIAYQLAKLLYLENILRNKNIISFFPFDNRLEGISRWFRQLWAESIGKRVIEQMFFNPSTDELYAKLFFSAGKLYKSEMASGINIEGAEIGDVKIRKKNKLIQCKIKEHLHVTGTTPLAWVGSRDNHSSWQLANAGPRDKTIIFTRVEAYTVDYSIPVEKGSKLYFLNGKKLGYDLERASQMGTEDDAFKNGIPNVTLYLPVKDERNIADYMYTLMMMTAVAGDLYEINAFDQPAVEGYKIMTKEILKRDKA